MKAGPKFLPAAGPGRDPSQWRNHRPEVEDHGFALFHFKVVALVDSAIGHRFERNRRQALEGHLRSHTQKRSDGIEEPST